MNLHVRLVPFLIGWLWVGFAEDGRFKKDVVVEIEKAAKRQPFLGGYRWKPTGVHFYHAATQTDYSVAPDNKVHIIRDQGFPSPTLTHNRLD